MTIDLLCNVYGGRRCLKYDGTSLFIMPNQIRYRTRKNLWAQNSEGLSHSCCYCKDDILCEVVSTYFSWRNVHSYLCIFVVNTKWHFTLKYAIYLENLKNLIFETITFETKMSYYAEYDIWIIKGRTIASSMVRIDKSLTNKSFTHFLMSARIHFYC